MKKVSPSKISGKDEMKPEYDFPSLKGGVRGKYYKAYRAGHKVVIHNMYVSVKSVKPLPHSY